MNCVISGIGQSGNNAVVAPRHFAPPLLSRRCWPNWKKHSAKSLSRRERVTRASGSG